MKKNIAEKLLAPSFISATITLCFGIAIRREKLEKEGTIFSDLGSQEYWMYLSFFILTALFIGFSIYCIIILNKDK